MFLLDSGKIADNPVNIRQWIKVRLLFHDMDPLGNGENPNPQKISYTAVKRKNKSQSIHLGRGHQTEPRKIK